MMGMCRLFSFNIYVKRGAAAAGPTQSTSLYSLKRLEWFRKEKTVVRILMEPFSRALVLESPHIKLDEHLKDIGIEAHRLTKVPDEDALIKAAQETKAQIIFKRSRVPITRKIIESCPDIHAIQLCSIGTDSVDKQACADHGVLVFNDPISNGQSVVELTIAHLIALSRRLYETNNTTHQNIWSKNATERYEIMGKVLGIVGLGNIGRQIARALESLGMQIGFYDNRPVAQEIGVEMGWRSYESLEELFANSDMVSVHTSAKDYRGKDNANLLDESLQHLGAKRPEGSPRLFLNLARGNLHSSEALLKAVSSRAVKRAAVDVYPSEPGPGIKDFPNPYAEEPRIICTPHIGGATAEAQPRIARRVSQTVAGFSRYGSLRDCVYAPRVKLSLADESRGHAVLAVVHSTSRGTKKAVDDAIFQAEVSNLGSAHRDFDNGVAYDLSVLDHPLTVEQLQELVEKAATLAKDPKAIRAVRQLVVPSEGW